MANATELRDAALAQVEANANAEWFEVAIDSVRQIAVDNHFFTTDDVWDYLNKHWSHLSTHNNSAMGAVMRTASKRGIVSATDRYLESKRPSSHARPIRVWKSNY
jgi:hypothetical protein